MVKMWAYGTTKSHLEKTLSIPLDQRKPSDGLIRMEVDIPAIDPDEVLIRVKASALNYNSIWSSLAHPVDPFALNMGFVKKNRACSEHLQDYSIFGSDACGEIVSIGLDVRNFQVGEDVIVHCNIVDSSDPVTHEDSMLSQSQSIWGYESNFGAFAEYTKVKQSQLLHKPTNIDTTDAGSLMLTLSTAYRMLIGKNGARLKSGETVLIWGATGGLGVFAIQLCKNAGCTVVAVVSGEEKQKIAIKLGADYVVDRKKRLFEDLIKDDGTPNLVNWGKAKRSFNRLGIPPIDVVFEHVGRETLGFSVYILKRGGRVVTCAASSGYNVSLDLRYLWMELKSIIGSHFANNYEAHSALELIKSGKIKPVVDSVNPIENIKEKIDEMYKGNAIGKIVFTHY